MIFGEAPDKELNVRLDFPDEDTARIWVEAPREEISMNDLETGDLADTDSLLKLSMIDDKTLSMQRHGKTLKLVHTNPLTELRLEDNVVVLSKSGERGSYNFEKQAYGIANQLRELVAETRPEAFKRMVTLATQENEEKARRLAAPPIVTTVA